VFFLGAKNTRLPGSYNNERNFLISVNSSELSTHQAKNRKGYLDGCKFKWSLCGNASTKNM